MMNQENQKRANLNSIPVFPKKLAVTTGFLTFLLVLAMSAEIGELLSYLHLLQTVHIPVAEQSIAMSDLDEKLTLLTYLKVGTGEDRWDKQHEIFQSGLRFTVEQLAKQILSMKNSKIKFDVALLDRQELTTIESEVFKTLQASGQKKAYDLLTDEKYLEGKQKYQEQLFKITGALSEDRENQLQYAQKKAVIICLSGLAGLFVLFVPWFFLIRAFLKSVNDEFAVQKELQQMTELQESQKIATAVAHQAGMAEVATGVLHNVGNILNGVNVGAENIQRVLKKSVLENFRKANGLVGNNKVSWGDFFLKDPKGSKVLDFYCQLEASLSFDYKTLQDEVTELQKKIQLIKDVVNLQQNHARGVEFKEEVFLHDTVENILVMQTNSLIRHDVKVIKKFADAAPILAQKAKLAHVVLNILKNAKEALIENKNDEKILIVEIGTDLKKDVFLKISDNGIGIAPENLKKIFNHGFTTKKTGHGFGLHHCANAVTEMDGQILVHSDGLGRGTTFTLTFKSAANAQAKAS